MAPPPTVNATRQAMEQGVSFSNASNSGSKMTWNDYYVELAKCDTDRGALVDSKFNAYDESCRAFMDDEAELLNTVLANQGFVFALLPSTTKGFVQSMHNCFVYEDQKGTNIIVGIKGSYFSSP